jgi:hypothetical protein
LNIACKTIANPNHVPGSQLFNTSGAGKTRVSLDGLCHHWGLYISCKSNAKTASGSRDFEAATNILTSMSTWNQSQDLCGIQKNAAAADHTFAMLLCARIFILGKFVGHLPLGTDPVTARRRWVLLQVMPRCLRSYFSDIFTVVFRSIRAADTKHMLDIARVTLRDCYTKTHLFPKVGSNGQPFFGQPFFVVIDEAQVAADNLSSFSRSSTEIDFRPILHELYRVFQDSKLFTGVIIAGTGLSMGMAECPVRGCSAKYMGVSQVPLILTETGSFWGNGSSQEAYVRRYLKFSDSVSDQRLLERILYWFSGRYIYGPVLFDVVLILHISSPRLTASLLELLLSSDNVPRHRVLTAFAKHLTGFTISDAIDLENEEGPISYELKTEMNKYEELSLVGQLFEKPNSEYPISRIDSRIL